MVGIKTKVNASAKRNLRYLLIEALNKGEIEKAILEGVGVIGWAKAEPVFVEDKSGNTGERFILAINREALDSVRASFELFSGKIKIARVSGTLKGLLGR